MQKKYKHLFFDLDNTLFDFDACANEALYECYQKYELDQWFNEFAEFMDVYKRHNDRLWLQYKHGEVKKDEVKYGRFRITLAEMNMKDEPTADAMAEDFLLFCSLKNILVEGAMRVVEDLSTRYVLHIISNGFIEVQHKKMELTGLSPFFNQVVLSEMVQAQKPSQKIFHHALSSANAKKSESLMIGDNWDADIGGASAYGMDQAYYSYHGTPAPGKATYHLNKLEDLLEFL